MFLPRVVYSEAASSDAIPKQTIPNAAASILSSKIAAKQPINAVAILPLPTQEKENFTKPPSTELKWHSDMVPVISVNAGCPLFTRIQRIPSVMMVCLLLITTVVLNFRAT